MENLIIFIIAVGTVIFKIYQSTKGSSVQMPRRTRDERPSQPRTFADNDDDELEEMPPPLQTRSYQQPTMWQPGKSQEEPPRQEQNLRELLEVLVNKYEEATTPAPPPVPPPVKPLVARVKPKPPAPPPVPKAVPEEHGGSGVSLPPLASPAASQKVFQQSIAAAFASDHHSGLAGQESRRKKFKVRVRGVADLRRAVVLNEVLGRARAYDV